MDQISNSILLSVWQVYLIALFIKDTPVQDMPERMLGLVHIYAFRIMNEKELYW